MRVFHIGSCIAAVATIVLASPAWAEVGVTSVTAGSPLGQPPAEPERVLRVGVDIFANERVTTSTNDRAHLVFLDGTALTVGPNSRVVLDKFVYDPDRKSGELSLRTAKGVFRLVGGNISKTSDIKITTPAATIGIRGGIVNFEVADNGATKATFVYGQSMTVTSQASTQTATRGGSEIRVDSGRPPSPPILVPPGGAMALAMFERAPAPLAANQAVTAADQNQNQNQMQPQPQTQTQAQSQTSTSSTSPPTTTTPATPPTTINVDTALDRSGFAKENSGQSIRQLAVHDRGHGIRGVNSRGGNVNFAGGRLSGPQITAVLKPLNIVPRVVPNNNSKAAAAQNNSGNNRNNGKGRGH